MEEIKLPFLAGSFRQSVDRRSRIWKSIAKRMIDYRLNPLFFPLKRANVTANVRDRRWPTSLDRFMYGKAANVVFFVNYPYTSRSTTHGKCTCNSCDTTVFHRKARKTPYQIVYRVPTFNITRDRMLLRFFFTCLISVRIVRKPTHRGHAVIILVSSREHR